MSISLRAGARCALAIAIGLFLGGFAGAEDGWARYRVYVRDAADAQKLTDSSLTLYAEQVTLGTTDVAVPPSKITELWGLGLAYRWVQDLPNVEMDRSGLPSTQDYKTEYLNYDNIIAQYEQWRLAHPRLITRTQIGTSIQNRPIWAYRIWSPVDRVNTASPKGPKQCYLMIGLIHAREWIAGSVPMYCTDMLISKYYTDPAYRTLLNKFAVYVVPCLNPDGYSYTWTNNRLWRKNRRNNGGGSYGVDLNRNFAKGWGGGGSSGNSNSETYRGTAAFSEPESNALRNFSLTLPPIKGFMDWHSYSELILYPWGYSSSQTNKAAQFNTMAVNMRNAMVAGGGRSYGYGQIYHTLYQASGVTVDWYFDQFQSMAMTIELRDTGQYGFELPPSQILPTCKEAWSGFDSMLKQL